MAHFEKIAVLVRVKKLSPIDRIARYSKRIRKRVFSNSTPASDHCQRGPYRWPLNPNAPPFLMLSSNLTLIDVFHCRSKYQNHRARLGNTKNAQFYNPWLFHRLVSGFSRNQTTYATRNHENICKIGEVFLTRAPLSHTLEFQARFGLPCYTKVDLKAPLRTVRRSFFVNLPSKSIQNSTHINPRVRDKFGRGCQEQLTILFWVASSVGLRQHYPLGFQHTMDISAYSC